MRSSPPPSAQGMMVGFEAAVAGGIPIIKAMREGLAGNRIEWVAGIINGTGNFILTEMRDKGRDFAGRAGRSPGAGLCRGGSDLRCRGHRRRPQADHSGAPSPSAFRCSSTRSTSRASAASRREDVAYAEQLGYRIKHLGIARRDARTGSRLRVHPTLIPQRRLHRQRQWRDERRAGQGRCGGPDPVLRGRGRRRADRLGGRGRLVDVVRT